MKSFDKLKTKLAELFQLDQADLDFGIYRIMNARRDEITQFLERDLLPQVTEAFAEYKPSDKAEIQKELDKVVEGIKAAGMDPDQSPKVKELRTRLADEAVDLTGLENEVYSRLYDFFNRYYDSGDFISLRRYKEGVYAIPYEGEEVKLHWANHDQYYIKTTEHFRDYAFKTTDGHRVHFKIIEADTEKDNIKAANGNDRRFLLHGDKPVAEDNGELVIRFEYRPDGEKRKQDAINTETAARIIEDLNAEELAAWQHRLSVNWMRADGTASERTILEKHLSDYTKRNTFDYFIHKDLGGFLRRELDFYIKNEVMHLDDVENESAPRVEQYLSKIRVIRRVAHKIIDFLAQIEGFQKKLWLKKKFVTETNYCITLDRVPEDLYAEVASNNAQREEWVRLFAIDEIKKDLAGGVDYSEPLTVEFLKVNPFLLLDTKFFSQEFKDRLLASFGDFDSQADGLFVHSDNFQALSCLQERYHDQIECVHIDPPYNTATSGFLYKNTYEHSSWLAMMLDRAVVAAKLLANDGAFQCHIDENEYESLYQVLDTIGLPDAGTIIWDKKNPMLGRKGIATQHEYVIWRGWCDGPIYLGSTSVRQILSAAKKIISKHGGVNDESRREFSQWMSNCDELTGGERAYRLLNDDRRVFQSVAMGAPEPRTNPKFHIPLIHPVTGKECPVPSNGWSRAPETIQKLIDAGDVVFGADEKTQPRKKVYLTGESKRQVSSVIEETGRGKQDVLALGVEFPYCHPVSLYEKLLGAGVSTHGVALDYFAGSGTTGHAIVNLNREDNGSRKYILVEMGEYFDTVLVPRIKKVVYSKDWKDGKPVSREGISHMFKYIRLESYEDALANIRSKRTEAQQTLLDGSDSFRESYMLGYMLDTEAAGSASLLDIDAFEEPFNYQLLVGTGSVGETKPVNVDLVETFNWLLGLRVRHMDYIRPARRSIGAGGGYRVVEGTNPKGEKVLVIWRNLKETSNEDLEEFFQKQQYNTLDMEFDLVYVNGDNNLMNIPVVPETEGAEPRYKVRLIEEEFKRLMFDVKDV